MASKIQSPQRRSGLSVSVQRKGGKVESWPANRVCVVSLSKALYSTCSSRLSCINEYQNLLGANLRWISVPSRVQSQAVSSNPGQPTESVLCPPPTYLEIIELLCFQPPHSESLVSPHPPPPSPLSK